MTRRLGAVVAIGLLAASCSSSPSTSTSSPARSTTSTALATTVPPSSVPSSSTAPTTTIPAMIRVDSPKPGAVVTSPFTLSGSANVFEAALNCELAAADGTILASMPFQATAGTGTWGTYSTSITFPSGHVGQAMLRVFSISAKDGSRINTVTVPVTLG